MAVQNGRLYYMKDEQVLRALCQAIVKLHPALLAEIEEEVRCAYLEIKADGTCQFVVEVLELTDEELQPVPACGCGCVD